MKKPFLVKFLIFFFIVIAFLVPIGFISSIFNNNIKIMMGLNSIIFLVLSFSFYISFYGNFKKLKIDNNPKNYLFLIFGVIILIISNPCMEYLSSLSENIFSSSLFKSMTNDFEETLISIIKQKTIIDISTNILVVAFLPAICEELLFRGTIQNTIMKYKNFHISIFITSFIFAILHFNSKSILPIFFIGIILGYAYYYSNNIIVPILIHFINNSISLYYLYILKEESFKIEPPSFFMVLLSIIGLFLSFIFLRYYIKKRGY